MKYFILTTLLLSLPLLAASELTFVETQVKAKAILGQKIVKVTFETKNNKQDAITIKSAKVTCDCMWMTTEFPLIVQPGDSVKLEAEYDTTGKLGLNRGRIIADVNGKNETLMVEIDIPAPFTVSPRFFVWQKGARDAKKVNVTINPEWQGSFTGATSKDPQVKAVLKSIKEGLEVTITPDASLGKKRTWVILKGKDANGDALENRIYLIFN
ncbi:MAG: DUF1573 domain-containing protein [Lentisphaerales bacterium]|nr:DUF1573 domain-containing protein [Lentisphaerales bacterium]